MPPYDYTGSSADTVWLTWTVTAATTSATTNLVWDAWTTGATSTGSMTVWQTWCDNTTGSYPYAPPLTEEQIAANAETARVRQQEQEKAKRRARELLVSCLEDDQKEELERDGFFHVETRDGTRRYKLRPGSAPIRVKGEDGRKWSYCIHPDYGFPPEDVVLAQKLLIESDEDEFLRIANASSVA
jgi:hypothetical protein